MTTFLMEVVVYPAYNKRHKITRRLRTDAPDELTLRHDTIVAMVHAGYYVDRFKRVKEEEDSQS